MHNLGRVRRAACHHARLDGTLEIRFSTRHYLSRAQLSTFTVYASLNTPQGVFASSNELTRRFWADFGKRKYINVLDFVYTGSCSESASPKSLYVSLNVVEACDSSATRTKTM